LPAINRNNQHLFVLGKVSEKDGVGRFFGFAEKPTNTILF
jgi:hypothetical protein